MGRCSRSSQQTPGDIGLGESWGLPEPERGRGTAVGVALAARFAGDAAAKQRSAPSDKEALLPMGRVEGVMAEALICSHMPSACCTLDTTSGARISFASVLVSISLPSEPAQRGGFCGGWALHRILHSTAAAGQALTLFTGVHGCLPGAVLLAGVGRLEALLDQLFALLDHSLEDAGGEEGGRLVHVAEVGLRGVRKRGAVVGAVAPPLRRKLPVGGLAYRAQEEPRPLIVLLEDLADGGVVEHRPVDQQHHLPVQVRQVPQGLLAGGRICLGRQSQHGLEWRNGAEEAWHQPRSRMGQPGPIWTLP